MRQIKFPPSQKKSGVGKNMMKKIILAICFLFLVSGASAYELLPNGSFEDDMDNWDFNWSDCDDCGYEITTEEASHGSKSLKFYDHRTTSDYNHLVIIHTSGQQYSPYEKVCADIKGESSGLAVATTYIRAGVGIIISDSIRPDWTTYCRYSIHSGDYSIEFIGSGVGDINIFVDNIRVEQLGIGAEEFTNYGFEEDEWVVGWDLKLDGVCETNQPLSYPLQQTSTFYDGWATTEGNKSIRGRYVGSSQGVCLSPKKEFTAGQIVCIDARHFPYPANIKMLDEEGDSISATPYTKEDWGRLCGRVRNDGRIAIYTTYNYTNTETFLDNFTEESQIFTEFDAPETVAENEQFIIKAKIKNKEGAQWGAPEPYPYPQNGGFENGDASFWSIFEYGVYFTVTNDWDSEGSWGMKVRSKGSSTTAFLGRLEHTITNAERGDKICFDYNADYASNRWFNVGIVQEKTEQIYGGTTGTKCFTYVGGEDLQLIFDPEITPDYINLYIDNIRKYPAQMFDYELKLNHLNPVYHPTIHFNCDVNGENCVNENTMLFDADTNQWYYSYAYGIPKTYYYWIDTYSSFTELTPRPIPEPSYFAYRSEIQELEVSTEYLAELHPRNIVADMNSPITIKATFNYLGEEIGGATCVVQIKDEGQHSMPYNSDTGYYEYTRSPYYSEIYKTYDVNCSYLILSDGEQGDILTIESLASQLAIQNISNTNYTINLYDVDLSPSSASGDLIFSVQNVSDQSLTNTDFTITNSLEDSRQYYIYTATPTQYSAGDWIFDSSLTYGTDYDNPIQKIWDSTNSYYKYTYEVPIISTGTKKYYKIVYRTPMRAWTSLEGTSEWLLLNEPTYNKYDIYTASPATNIWAKFLTATPDLTSGEPHSYEFQFTAYADTNGATLKVGYRDEETGVETFVSLQLTTAKKRYSVPIQDDWLIFKTENLSTGYTIYMKDYSLSQRGFFKTKLEERTLGNSTLPVANYSGTTVNTMDGNFDPLIIHVDQNYGQTITMPTVDGDWEAITIRIGKLTDCNQSIPLVLSVYTNPSKTSKVGDVSIYCSNIPEDGLVNWFDAKIYWTTPIDYDGKDTYYFEYTTDANAYANEAYYLYEPEGIDPYAGGQKYDNGSPDSDDDLMFMLHTSGAYEYIIEGEDFRINTYAYDRDNLITTLEIDAYLDAYADSNKLKHWEYDVNTGTENTFLINNILDSLIDLRGTDNPAKILITATLCGDDKCYEQISDWIYMRQFPSMPMDVFIKLRNYENRKGNYPRGKTELLSTNTESIKAVEITIFETSLLANHTAEEILQDNTLYKARDTFYKDEYFSCYADECTFDWGITDWVYEKATTTEDNYTIWANVITNTSYPDYENILLNKSLRTTTIVDKWVLFRTVEAYHRGGAGDYTPEYRNWEEIRLLGQLRNPQGDYLGDDVDTWIEIRDCGTTADCTDTGTTNGEIAFENVKFRPTDYKFYPDTKVNTWFFEGLLTEDNGGLLQDGHHYRVKFVVEDKSGKYYDYNSTNLSWAEKPFTFNLGWTLENLGYYFTDEVFLTINNAYAPTTPQLQCGGCVRIQNQDVDGMESLEQTLLCGVLYTSNDTVPENFLITLSNQNSNFNEDDEGLQQFIKTKINWKDIAHSDGAYTAQQITANIDETIEDSGDMLLYGLKSIGGDAVANWIGEGVTDLTNIIGFGISPTSGLTTDCNLTIPVDEVAQIFFYEIKGIDIVNKYSYDSEGNINPRNFYKWASENDISLPDNKTTMNVWVNGEIVETKTLPSRFVVHAEPTQEKIQEAEDANTTGETEYLGQYLTFDMSIGMLYNNQQDNQEVVLPMKYLVKFETGASQDSADLQKNVWEWLTGTNDIDGDGHPDDGFFDNPVGKIMEIPFIITGWMLGNAVWFAVIVLIVLVLAFVVRAIRSGGGGSSGGQTVINLQGNERG